MYPEDPSGPDAEVVNCRCALLEQARWVLGNSFSKMDNESKEIVDFRDVDDYNEFKKKYSEKANNIVENNYKSSKMILGAVSGGRNPFGEKAKEHAKRYYGLVRSMKTDVDRISKTTGYSRNDIQSIKDFVFCEKHDLGNGKMEYFEPDYMMAESWQRLINGNPESHDLTLLKHEMMEKRLMSKGMSQDEAHRVTSNKYNYSKEAAEYYAKIKKYKE